MERLTKRINDVVTYIGTENEYDTGMIAAETASSIAAVREILLRLAAYEDTGLTPEEIKAPFTEDAMINLAAQALGVEADRLRELSETDKDGRCAVLPCKPRTDMINKILPKSPYLMERVHFAVAYVHKGSIYLMTQRTFEGGVKNGAIVSAATERALEGRKDG